MKKIGLRLSVLMAVLFTTSQLFAQITIKGNITDSDYGDPVIGANIFLLGTTKGTVTDIDGNYTLEVPDTDAQLKISYVGLEDQTIAVGENTIIDIVMASGKILDEVVVTALGIERDKKSLGYAVQEVSGAEISEAKEVNVTNSLKGKIAGVQIKGSSNIGGSTRMTIRGNKSISNANEPLYIVDGVPINNSNFRTNDNQSRGAGGYDYGNAAQDINSDDIEDVSVLKGPTATALYGSRGANGVVMITTKAGKARKGIGVEFTSSFSIEDINIFPEYQNEYGGGSSNEFFEVDGQLVADYGYDGSWGPKYENQMVRHWDSWFPGESNYGELRPWAASNSNVEDFFVTGNTISNHVALNGGNEKSTFRLGYTNLYQTGTQVNSKIKRNTISFNGTLALTDKISAGISTNYVNTNGYGRPLTGYGESIMSQFNQWFQRQVDMKRLEDYKTSTGIHRTWNQNDAVNGDLTPHYWDNPYWERYENYEDDRRDRLFGNVSLSYDFTDWLKLTGRAMTDFYDDKRNERVAIGGVREASYNEFTYFVRENNYDVILSADKFITEDIGINAFVGANLRNNTREETESRSVGGLGIPNFYNLANSVGSINNTSEIYESAYSSVFGSAEISYARMLYLTLTGRNDWFSTLPVENNNKFYPSASLSFVFSELINQNWFSYGKIRAGWAQVANDASVGAYKTSATYEANTNTVLPSFSVPDEKSNPDLRLETTSSFEVGLEFNLFNNRIGADISYYNDLTVDLITTVDLPGATGYTSYVTNAGEMTNKGYELQLNFSPIKTKNFEWGIGVNLAQNTNEVVKLAKGLESIRLSSLFGIALEARPGEEYGQLVGTNFVYDDNGNKLVSEGVYLGTGDLVNPGDQLENLGSVFPDQTGGISTKIRFKNFNLSTLFDFQSGGHLLSLTNQWGKYSGTLPVTTENGIRENGITVEGMNFTGFDDDGNPLTDGTKNETNIDAQTHFFSNQGYVINAADVYSSDYIKWRELRLGYSLGSKVLNRLKLTDLTLSLVGRNLALLYSDVPHIDPESTVSSSNIQGFEGGQLPSQRSIGLSLNLKF